MKNNLKRMFAAAKKDSVLELFVYNSIGEDWYGGGVTPQSVQDAITAAKADGGFTSITVHVNSPGGDSFDGVAIHNILRQQNCPVNVLVEGLAASAAFTISMAGDTVGVCDGAMMMLHNAWSVAIGEAKDMRKMADLLEKVSNTMCSDIYAKRSGMTAAEVQQLMDAETWMTADEAVSKGFATEKVDTTPEKSAAAKSLAASFDLARFGHKIPDSLKSKGKEPKNDIGCQCPCNECMNDDCESCSHTDCDCVGCECPQHDADEGEGDMNDSAAKPVNACTVCGKRATMVQVIETDPVKASDGTLWRSFKAGEKRCRKCVGEVTKQTIDNEAKIAVGAAERQRRIQIVERTNPV